MPFYPTKCCQCSKCSQMSNQKRVVVNNRLDRIPSGTSIYSSNVVCFDDIENPIGESDNNIILLDAYNVENKTESSSHSLFIGRNMNDVQPNQTICEFGGMTRQSTHLNGSIKFKTSDNIPPNVTTIPTVSAIELNGKEVTTFRNINTDITNTYTDSITMKIFNNSIPSNTNVPEGTIALFKNAQGYKLIIFNGTGWQNL